MSSHFECKNEQLLDDVKQALFGREGLCQTVNSLSNDVAWLKRIGGYIAAILSGIMIALIVAFIIYLTKVPPVESVWPQDRYSINDTQTNQ